MREKQCKTCFEPAGDNCRSADSSDVKGILKKHLWFTDADLVGEIVCSVCWASIDSFHKFYVSVEKLYGTSSSNDNPDILLVHVASTSDEIEIKDELESRSSNECDIFLPENENAIFEEDDETLNEDLKNEDSLELTDEEPNFSQENPDEVIKRHVSLDCEQCSASDLTFKELFAHTEKVHAKKLTSITCCGTKYHTRIRLYEHVKFVFNPQMYKCKQCDQVCSNGINLKRHLRVQHGEDIPVRPYNNSNRLLKWKLGVNKTGEQIKKEQEAEQRRQKRQQEDELILEHVKFECVPCGLSLSTFGELFSHSRSTHKNKPVITCCGNRYNSRQRLLQHVQSLKNPVAFRCDLCFRCFRNEYAKNKHMFEMHPTEEDLKYKCNRCPKVFVRELKFRQHMKDHEDCDNEKIKCEDCGKMFKSHHILYMHVRKKHREPQFVCDICAKAFHLQSEFKRHKIQHEDPDQLKMQCQHCLRWFKNREYWRAHVRLHVVGEVECELCGRISPNRRAHRAHVKNAHGARNKKCTWCGKCFNKDINLREHIASRHTGDMLYTCSFCPKTFNSNANMHSHRKKMHPVEWLAMRESAAEAQMPAGVSGSADRVQG
ncbi:zinc finger protein 675-like [Malaya genurostris]|uniref:zinc finger protein 675-like n=1 Tax=Malaya genurostris TaxID=325434 RepID=UPI0026F3A2B2|nr:zinc finger protein 675-like [Malaya genurostris]